VTLQILEQDLPGLGARLRELTPERRRRLARAAAELALRRRPVDDPRVAAAWPALRGEAPAEPAATALQTLVDELDDESARLQRELEEARAQGRPEAEIARLDAADDDAFESARAAAALVAALDPDADRAVVDALYEATYALGFDTALTERLVEAAVAGAEDPAQGL
jgi:hypothetical protein